DGVDVDGRGLPAVVPLLHQPGGDDVLARLLPQLEVLTGAGDGRLESDLVDAGAGLAGDEPNPLFEPDPAPGGGLQRLQFTQVHGGTFWGRGGPRRIRLGSFRR